METRRGQLSLRPALRVLDRIRARARIRGERHTTLAERYLTEGLLMDEHPGIHFVDGAMGRRPAVMGTGLDVWQVVDVVQDNGGSVEAAAAYLEIAAPFVHAAIGYYGSNREEIDGWTARVREFNEQEEARWRAARSALSA